MIDLQVVACNCGKVNLKPLFKHGVSFRYQNKIIQFRNRVNWATSKYLTKKLFTSRNHADKFLKHLYLPPKSGNLGWKTNSCNIFQKGWEFLLKLKNNLSFDQRFLFHPLFPCLYTMLSTLLVTLELSPPLDVEPKRSQGTK